VSDDGSSAVPQEPGLPNEEIENAGPKLVVPDTSLGDGVAAGVQALVGLVPGVGATMSVIVDYQRRRFASEKQTAFNNAVAEDLERLHIKADELTAQFYATLSHVDWLVSMTNEPEKVDAFRNIMLNTVLPNAPEAELRELFLTIVASLTGRHIRLLDAFINSPKYNIAVVNSADFHVIGGTYKAISEHVPGFERRDILERCINDLINQRLVYYQGGDQVREASLLELMSDPHPTGLGYDFVVFISRPKDLAHADQPKEQDG